MMPEQDNEYQPTGGLQASYSGAENPVLPIKQKSNRLALPAAFSSAFIAIKFRLAEIFRDNSPDNQLLQGTLIFSLVSYVLLIPATLIDNWDTPLFVKLVRIALILIISPVAVALILLLHKN